MNQESSSHTVHSTLYTVHCTQYTVHSTLYTVHCTLYTVHSTLYTVHCTLYYTLTVHCKFGFETYYIAHKPASYFSTSLLICICFQNNSIEEYFK